VEDNAFVRVVAVVVVPVEQRRRLLRRCLQDVHAEQPRNVGFARARQERFGHHAHQRAGHDPVELLEGGPALDGRGAERLLVHPPVDGDAELGHLHQAQRRNALDSGIGADAGELRLHRRLAVGHPLHPPKQLGEIERFDGNPRSLEQLLAVPHRVERRRTRANRTDARVLQAPRDATGRGEAPEVFGKTPVRRRHGVERRQRIRDAVLAEVVADRHLAAEAVAALVDGHARTVVGKCVHEHWHVETGPSQRVGHGPFVAEVRQRHEDAIDLVAMQSEQISAGARVGQRLDRSIGRRVGGERHGAKPAAFEGVKYVGASGRAEM
jgi:hypothetical protein